MSEKSETLPTAEPIDPREWYQKVRDAATKRAGESVNPLWKRANLQFADAADRLDAMIVRSTATAF